MGRRPSLSTNDRCQALGMLRAGQSSRQVAAGFGNAQSTMSRLFQRFNTTQSMIGDVLVVLGQQQGNKTIKSVTLLSEIGESLQELCNIS